MQIRRPCTFIASTFLCFITIACGETMPARPAQVTETSGDGTVASPMHIGKDVTPPMVSYQTDPDYTLTDEEKKHIGDIVLGFIVDEQGIPQNVHIVRCTHKDLCDSAMEAVRKDRFRPATYQGRPVAVDLLMHFNIDPY
jgi:TonB family protein